MGTGFWFTPSLGDAGNGLEKISATASLWENFSAYVGLYPGSSLKSCIATPARLSWLWCKRAGLLFLASWLISSWKRVLWFLWVEMEIKFWF